MVPASIRRIGSRAFSLTELMVVVAIIGIVATLAVPYFVSYWRNATVRAGAEELAALLNGARQLAIARNTTVCVVKDPTRIRYLLNGCAGAPWIGAGTDGTGYMSLSNQVQVTAATANVAFNYLGAAIPAGTYTVKNATGSETLSVIVAASGRISIGP